MAIRLGTKKLIKDGCRYRQIIKITGVVEKAQLPPEYLKMDQYVFAVPLGIEIHNNNTVGTLVVGEEHPEGVFLTILDIIKRAGNNLLLTNGTYRRF